MMIRDIRKGDVCWANITFDDDRTIIKRRPIVVLDVSDKGLVVVICETRGFDESGKYYDQFKVPLWDWRSYGLSHASYAKTHKVYEVHAKSLDSYIGHMTKRDLKNIIDRINASL